MSGPAPGPGIDTVAELFQPVWRALTSLDLRRLPPPPAPARRGLDGPTSVVHITGAWAGTVVLRCAAALGNQVATQILGLQDQEPGPDDVRDVAGEIVNVLGGKIKSTLSGPCQLSLPTVIDGLGHEVHLVAGRSLGELWFESSGHLLVVSVWLKKENPTP